MHFNMDFKLAMHVALLLLASVAANPGQAGERLRALATRSDR